MAEVWAALGPNLMYASSKTHEWTGREAGSVAGLFWDHRCSDSLATIVNVIQAALELIDSAEIPDKVRYAKILRALLSSAELDIILWISLTPGLKLAPFVEKFGLLAYMDTSRYEGTGFAELFGPDFLSRMFVRSAFAENIEQYWANNRYQPSGPA